MNIRIVRVAVILTTITFFLSLIALSKNNLSNICHSSKREEKTKNNSKINYNFRRNFLIQNFTLERFERFSPTRRLDGEMLEYIMKVQAPRLTKATESCHSVAASKTHNPSTETILDSSHRLIYCDNRKAASSSILNYMLAISGVDTSLLNVGEVNIYSRLKAFKKWSENRQDQKKESFLFTSVRHPFKRFVSCYRDKIVNPIYLLFGGNEGLDEMLSYRNRSTQSLINEKLPMFIHEDDINKHNGQHTSKHFLIRKCPKLNFRKLKHNPRPETPPSGTPNFREFLLHGAIRNVLCSQLFLCNNSIDNHILPMVSYCNPCILLMDYIMKVETLQDDFSHFINLLDLPALGVQKWTKPVNGYNENGGLNEDKAMNKSHLLKINNSSGRKGTSTYEDYMSEISDLELDLLYTAYFDDFQTFGYEPDE